MSEPQVTIVVTPRERFSYTRESLESIYQYTKVPFKLVYVDGNSPTKIRQYLEAKSQEKGFEIIRTNYYLFPNRSRNLGLERVETPYVVFVDNDVIVTSGWLEALIQCSEETGATVVGPLVCQEEPVHETIHFAGGESRIIRDIKGRLRLREKMYKQGRRVADIRPQLQRTPTELSEFHCTLVKTEVFRQISFFDEAMLNTKEHVDFCMAVAQVGGTVYFEPDSVATYVPGKPLKWTDLHFYMLRWSDAWELASLSRMQEKWGLAEDSYFKQKYKALGWRRRDTILLPLIQKITFGIKHRFLQKVLMYGLLAPVEKRLNRYLTTQYAKQHLQQQQVQAPTHSKILETATSRN
ncbi:glycosyltransferase family 2 protein [Leptolyngbya sp. FACHB-671]|uniref:glycosyltransferase family 2 protein n=1 Tax=Leptolyngbya sp. FACHB-671 TaxID=2692812 RepID=UPI001682F880|nr:glycosyltransferase [Leptolyngbya sp. FACHB-671]MBD2069395.1 glycosyltransferase family 2 protein [Leptolyngbya sp. FACHB-671]